MRDRARVHKGASTQSWALVLAFYLAVEEILGREEPVVSSAAIDHAYSYTKEKTRQSQVGAEDLAAAVYSSRLVCYVDSG